MFALVITLDMVRLAALERSGAKFSSMTGYIEGDLTTESGADALLRTAEQSIEVAKRLACPRLNLHGTGLDVKGLPVAPVPVVTGRPDRGRSSSPSNPSRAKRATNWSS